MGRELFSGYSTVEKSLRQQSKGLRRAQATPVSNPAAGWYNRRPSIVKIQA
jgi:hypothetical protein